MGVGVTEQEVYGAADAVLARGERPTYERVRTELGRGSPARVGQLLETWWAGLAARLAQRLALPVLPAEVSDAFANAWEAALAAGRTHAEAQVAPERAALAEAVERMEAAVDTERQTSARLTVQLAHESAASKAASGALAISEVRNADLTRQVGALQMEQQALSTRLDATLAHHQDALLGAKAERAAAAVEREALNAHVRQVENRAAAEIDRSREELKRVGLELKTAISAMAVLERERDQARRDENEADRRAVAAESRARALESLDRSARGRRSTADSQKPLPAVRRPRKARKSTAP